MSSDTRHAEPVRRGKAIEGLVSETFDAIELDRNANHFDAVATDTPSLADGRRVTITHSIVVRGGECVAADDPVEIKATRLRVSRDNRRGRWLFRPLQHRVLCALDAVYALTVYDEPRRGEYQLAAVVFVRARELDATLWGRWHHNPSPDEGDRRCRLPWSRVVEPMAVENWEVSR